VVGDGDHQQHGYEELVIGANLISSARAVAHYGARGFGLCATGAASAITRITKTSFVHVWQPCASASRSSLSTTNCAPSPVQAHIRTQRRRTLGKTRTGGGVGIGERSRFLPEAGPRVDGRGDDSVHMRDSRRRIRPGEGGGERMGEGGGGREKGWGGERLATWSPAKRLSTRPTGVVSKNRTGARSTARNMRACSRCAARKTPAFTSAVRAMIARDVPSDSTAYTPR